MILQATFLLSLLSSYYPSVSAQSGSIAITISAGAAFPFQCSNGMWTAFGQTLQAFYSINKGPSLPPMAENGLPTIDMAFFVNGQPSNIAVSGTFNMDRISTKGNVWTFGLMDDQSVIGGTIAVGTCSQGQAVPHITASTSSNFFISGATASGIPTIINGLNAANVATGNQTGSTPVVVVTAAPTAAPTTATAVTTTAPTNAPTTATAVSATGTIAITVAAKAAMAFQCSNGKWTSFGQNFAVATIVNGGTAHQPMAETGLPTIDMAFFVSGKAAAVTVSGTFNIDRVSTNGNVFTFGLMDDGPNIGGTIAVGSCTQGQVVPQITASFSSNFFIQGQGFNSPFIPAVNGIPKIINNLNPVNVATGTVIASTPTPTTTSVAPTNTPTQATAAPTQATAAPTTAKVTPTSAPTQATAAPTTATGTGQTPTGTISITISQPAAISFRCNNGKWTAFGQGFFTSTKVNGGSAGLPMAETGLPVINMAWFVGGQPAAVTVSGVFNVDRVSSQNNVWSFGLMDDNPNFGATIAVGTCTQGQAIPKITASFSTTTFIVGQGVPSPFIPAVSAVPTIVNALNAANVATASANVAAASTPQDTAIVNGTSITSGALIGISISASVLIGGLILLTFYNFRKREASKLAMKQEMMKTFLNPGTAKVAGADNLEMYKPMSVDA